MPLLHILLSKIKQHHVSELGVTCWVGWVCVGGVSSLVLFINSVRRVQIPGRGVQRGRRRRGQRQGEDRQGLPGGTAGGADQGGNSSGDHQHHHRPARDCKGEKGLFEKQERAL